MHFTRKMSGSVRRDGKYKLDFNGWCSLDLDRECNEKVPRRAEEDPIKMYGAERSGDGGSPGEERNMEGPGCVCTLRATITDSQEKWRTGEYTGGGRSYWVTRRIPEVGGRVKEEPKKMNIASRHLIKKGDKRSLKRRAEE